MAIRVRTARERSEGGRGDLDEHPGDGGRRAVERLEAAMNTLMSGDASAIKALYSHRDDVTAFFGLGGYEKGWAEVSRRWDWAAAQFQGGGPVRYEHLTAVTAPGLAVTTTSRHPRPDCRRPAERGSNRVTHVFASRTGSGGWSTATRTAWRPSTSPAPGSADGPRPPRPRRCSATACGRAGRYRLRRAASAFPQCRYAAMATPSRASASRRGGRAALGSRTWSWTVAAGSSSSGPRGRAEIALRPLRGPAHTRGGSVARFQLRCLPTAPTNARTSRATARRPDRRSARPPPSRALRRPR